MIMKIKTPKIRIADLTVVEREAIDKQYKRFHRKYVKGMTVVTGIDLENCRVAFMEKYNLEK